MVTDRTMLPVPKDSVASQECVGDNEIGEPADGLATEVVAEPDVACHSERGERERAPLLLEPRSVSIVETPRTPSNGSMGESLHSSSHFLILISDY